MKPITWVSDIDTTEDEADVLPSLPVSEEHAVTVGAQAGLPVADKSPVNKAIDLQTAMAADIFLPVTMCLLGFVVLVVYSCVWLATVNPSVLSSPAINNVVDAVFDKRFSQTILPLSTILTGFFVGSVLASLAYCACAFDPIIAQNTRRFFDLSGACVVRWLVAIAATIHLLPKLIFHGLLGSSSLLFVSLAFKIQFLTALTLTSGFSVFLMEWSLYLLDRNHVIVSPFWIYSCAASILLNSVGFLILLDSRLAFKSIICADGECSLSVLGQLASYAPVPLLCAHIWLVAFFIRYRLLKRNVPSRSNDDEGNSRRHSFYSSHTEWLICALAAALVMPTVLRVAFSVFYSFLSIERLTFAWTFHVYFLVTTFFAASLLALAVWMPVEGPTVSILGLYRPDGSSVDRNAETYDVDQCSEIARHSDESNSFQSEFICPYDDEGEHGNIVEEIPTLHRKTHLADALQTATLACSEPERFAPINHLQKQVEAFNNSLAANVEALVTESARDAKQKKIGWWQGGQSSNQNLESAIGTSSGVLEVSGRDSKVQDDNDDDVSSLVTLCDHRMCVIKRYFYGNLLDCYFDLHGRLRFEITPQQLHAPGYHDATSSGVIDDGL